MHCCPLGPICLYDLSLDVFNPFHSIDNGNKIKCDSFILSK